MLRVNALTGFGGGGSRFSLTLTDTDTDTTDDMSAPHQYTFASKSLGNDTQNRYTVVAVGLVRTAGATISSVTVAGQAASVVSDGVTNATTTDGDFITVALYIVDTTGQGATGNVVVTISDDTFGVGIAVYSLVNPSSSQADAVTVDNTDTSGELTLSVNISGGGAAIAASQQGVGGTHTWVGVTEDIDDDVAGASTYYFSSAHGGSPGSPHTITCQSADTTPNGMCGISASWSP